MREKIKNFLKKYIDYDIVGEYLEFKDGKYIKRYIRRYKRRKNK